MLNGKYKNINNNNSYLFLYLNFSEQFWQFMLLSYYLNLILCEPIFMSNWRKAC